MIEKCKLGSTGIEVAPIGISSSFGANTDVFRAALDRGCNYFTWGTFIKGRSSAFKDFVRQLCRQGRRQEVVIGLLSYSHSALLGDRFLKSALTQLGTDYVDGLILGYYPKRPPQRVLDWAVKVKQSGLVRAIGLTTHNREVVVPLIEEGIIDYFHIRYNAVHRGAEQDIFPHLKNDRPGLVSFTATSWGQLINQKKMVPRTPVPRAGDCYRFVLARDEIDVCMMGVKDLSMFEDNMKIIEQGPMTAEELAGMRVIGDHIYR